MDGFLPLVEGFLAYALTMLALTTAVSTLVGVGQRFLRSRAKGLRIMVRLLYLRELERFSNVGKNDEDEKTRAEKRLENRVEFITNMTLMPVPKVVNELEVDEESCRRGLESVEGFATKEGWRKLFHPIKLLRRWNTLRYGLEALTDEEFKHRLAESTAIRDLKQQKAKLEEDSADPEKTDEELNKAKGELEKLPGDWQKFEAQLLQTFKTIGAASSENFGRHSRGWAVLVGFLLAFGINVDSIDLLNSYLTDPTLRKEVIESQAGASEASPGGAGDAATSAQAGDQLLAATRDLGERAETLEHEVQARLRGVLGPAASQRAVAAVQPALDQVKQEVEDVESGLTDLGGSLTEAQVRAESVARALTTSFPVGWNRFPGCSENASSDLRCLGQNFEPPASKMRSWETFGLWGPLNYPWKVISGGLSRLDDWFAMLALANERDPTDFSQWLVGVVLTGLLLGLGTPFWVQVVNAGFSLRRWTSKEEPPKQGDDQVPAAPVVQILPVAQAAPEAPAETGGGATTVSTPAGHDDGPGTG